MKHTSHLWAAMLIATASMPAMAQTNTTPIQPTPPAPTATTSAGSTGTVGATNPITQPAPDPVTQPSRDLTNPQYNRAEGALDQQRVLNQQKAGTLPQTTSDGRANMDGSATAPRRNPSWNNVDGRSDTTR